MAEFTELIFDEESDWAEEITKENISNRILILNCGIDNFVLEEYVLFIMKWNREDKDIPVNKRKKIKIYINSPGGNTIANNMLVDIIALSETPIIGVGMGHVSSAAVDVLLSCHERLALPGTTILIHDGGYEISNSAKKAKETIAYFDELDAKEKEFVLARTNISSEFYDGIYGSEFYIGAEKAKELGVIDKIVGVDCKLEYIW